MSASSLPAPSRLSGGDLEGAALTLGVCFTCGISRKCFGSEISGLLKEVCPGKLGLWYVLTVPKVPLGEMHLSSSRSVGGVRFEAPDEKPCWVC